MEIAGIEADDLDISNMDSSSKWREFIAGMKNAGSINVELVFKTGMLSTIAALLGTSQTWTITIAGGGTFVCDGFLRALSQPIAFEEEITQTFEVKLSGIPTFTS